MIVNFPLEEQLELKEAAQLVTAVSAGGVNAAPETHWTERPAYDPRVSLLNVASWAFALDPPVKIITVPANTTMIATTTSNSIRVNP